MARAPVPKRGVAPRSPLRSSPCRRSDRRGGRVGRVAACLLLAGVLPLSGLEGQAVPIPLDTVPVVGSRVSASLPIRSRGVQILDRAAIEGLPASDLAGVLRWGLGVEVAARSPAQADLSMRGAGFEQVLVLVDGVRMNDPQTGHFHLNLPLPLDGVERIELLRGPASASYGGDAVGGVVNIVTRSDPGVTLGAEGGSFGSLRGQLRGAWGLGGGARLTLAAEEARSDGHREGTDWRQRLLHASLTAPMLGGRSSITLGRGGREFGADHFYAPFPSFETTVARTASIGWRPHSGTRLRVEPRLSWRRHDDDFVLVREDPSLYRNEHTSTQLSGEVTVRGVLGPGLALAAGSGWERSRLDSPALGDHEEDRRSLFGEAAWVGEGRAGGNVGFRLDDHDAFGAAYSPSVGAFVRLGEGVRIRGSWARAFRGASWTERYYVDPTHEAQASLDPERATTFDGAVVLESSAGATASIGAFRRVSRDLIDWARSAGDDAAVWETRNVNRAVFRGIELEGRWRPGAPAPGGEGVREVGSPGASGAGGPAGRGFQVELGATFLSLESDAEGGLESKYALRPMTEQVTIALSHDLVRGARGSVRTLYARRGGEASYRMVDLGADLPVWTGRLRLELRNATDADPLDLTGHPVQGRSVVVGYRIGLP